MASAVWLSDTAATAASSAAIQTEEGAVKAALVSDRTVAFTPVAKSDPEHVFLVDMPIRDWVEVRFSVLYTLKEWRGVCKNFPSTHDTDDIWGPPISKDDPGLDGMTGEERDAYRYAAHVVRRRGVDEPKGDLNGDWVRGGACNNKALSGWTLRDSSAGILSTQLCTAKIVEVPPRGARGDYFASNQPLPNGVHRPHTAFPLLELECTERAKWHEHVFVLAVYSTAYTRAEYNAMCKDDSVKVQPRMRDERNDPSLHRETYKKMVRNGTLPSRRVQSRQIDAKHVAFPLWWQHDAELCESIPLAARRVTKRGHVGPLLTSGRLGAELTEEDHIPRWLVAHRINSNYQTGKPQCVIEALGRSGVVQDGSAFRTLVWNDGEQPRMIVRSECSDLLAALINAKGVINVRYVSRLRMRAAIASEGLQVYPPDAAAPILEERFKDKQSFAKATQRAMYQQQSEESYRQFFARNMQQQRQIDTAYGAAKRTKEQTVARTRSESDSLNPASKRPKRNE